VDRRATYSYLANSHLQETLKIQSDTGAGWNTDLETTKVYDPNRDLIAAVQNKTSGGTPGGALSLLSEYAYTYDEIGQRSSVMNTGSAFAQTAFNLFDYNDKNEVVASL